MAQRVPAGRAPVVIIGAAAGAGAGAALEPVEQLGGRPRDEVPGGTWSSCRPLGKHDTMEVYDHSGRRHVGDFDPWDGRQIGDPDPTRSVEP